MPFQINTQNSSFQIDTQNSTSNVNTTEPYRWEINIASGKWLGAVRQQAITWSRSLSPYGVTRTQWFNLICYCCLCGLGFNINLGIYVTCEINHKTIAFFTFNAWPNVVIQLCNRRIPICWFTVQDCFSNLRLKLMFKCESHEHINHACLSWHLKQASHKCFC